MDKFKIMFFIIGALIAAVVHSKLYGTLEYVIRMLSKWWI